MKIINRRASYDYQLLDHFEAGVDLLGAEVKPVKAGHADLTGSFVKIIGLQAYLVNARVFPYQYARPESYDEKRTRKLLLHKRQILSLKSKMEGGNLTIVPISLYTTHNLIKIDLALGKSKKQFQKKAALKKQVLDREMEEALKGNY